MNARRCCLVAVLALTLTAPAAAASAARWRPYPSPPRWSEGAARLPVAGGYLEVSLVPDRGGALPLVASGGNRWVLAAATERLVGDSYSVVLRNRTRERLKVVVGVDGLNVYEREVVVGRADRDVGSILAPWGERTLPGWQIGSHRAQRFVFSPHEWSEGQGRTDAQIGLVTVQVYREWRGGWRDDERDGASMRRREAPAEAAPRAAAPQQAPSASADAGEEAAGGSPPIGTTAGDDVRSDVRTVRFVAATPYPEAWAVIDYGQSGPAPWDPPPVDLFGLRLEPDRDGARIAAVAPGSPAAEAGLQPWDVIVRLDTVSWPSVATARRILGAKRPGDYAFVRVRRGRHELAVKIRG